MSNRLRYAWWRATPGAWIAIALGVLSVALVPFITGDVVWPMVGVAFAFLGTVGGFTLTQWWEHGLRFGYGALTITTYPGCVPLVSEEEWAQIYAEWWRERWQAWALRNDYSRKDLMQDGEVHFTPEAPHTGWYRSDEEAPEGEDASKIPDADEDRAGIQSHGQHWPGARLILVHDEKAMGSTTKHELDLMACEIAAVRDGPLERDSPFDSIEEDKIEWMEKQGIH